MSNHNHCDPDSRQSDDQAASRQNQNHDNHYNQHQQSLPLDNDYNENGDTNMDQCVPLVSLYQNIIFPTTMTMTNRSKCTFGEPLLEYHILWTV